MNWNRLAVTVLKLVFFCLATLTLTAIGLPVAIAIFICAMCYLLDEAVFRY